MQLFLRILSRRSERIRRDEALPSLRSDSLTGLTVLTQGLWCRGNGCLIAASWCSMKSLLLLSDTRHFWQDQHGRALLRTDYEKRQRGHSCRRKGHVLCLRHGWLMVLLSSPFREYHQSFTLSLARSKDTPRACRSRCLAKTTRSVGNLCGFWCTLRMCFDGFSI